MNQPFGIKGVTDAPRPPVVAKVKIGRRVKATRADGSEYERPEKLDHFIFVEPGTGNPLPEFDVLGAEPKTFLAVFPPDADSTIDVAWKKWNSVMLLCRGDGDEGIDQETGEARQCAGEYNKEHPELHLCPDARPTPRMKNGKQMTDQRGNLMWNAPLCGPRLTMRLVMPLAGALGLVQMDTGGVASSVQTLWWQLSQIRAYNNGNLAGVVIKVGVREFTTKHGTSYGWYLATPTDAELETLNEQFARTAPIKVLSIGASQQAALPAASVPIDDGPEDPGETIEGEVMPEDEPAEAEPVPEQPDPATFSMPGEAVSAELAYKKAVGKLPQASRDAKLSVMEANRAAAYESGVWDDYTDWLLKAAEYHTRAGK